MGCGAGAQRSARSTTVWACQYCAAQFASFEECERHEKSQCQQRNGQASKLAPADRRGLREFLTGLGVGDVAKSESVLKANGIMNVGDFRNLDEDMRAELDEELKKGGVNLGDRAKIKRADMSNVDVKQGNGIVTVQILQPAEALQTASAMERVFLGLGWTARPGAPRMDVDASLVGFSSGNPKDVVFYGHLRNDSRSIVHTGDVLTGAPPESKVQDMERIYVWLTRLPQNIDTLVFVANVYSGGDWSSASDAYIRLANADTNQEFGRMALAGSGLKGDVLVFAKLYRCGKKGCWQFHMLGMPLSLGNHSNVNDVIPHLTTSGSAFPPPTFQGGAASIVKVTTPGSTGQPHVQPPPKPTKSQVPTGVYAAGGMAVATAAGIAAATYIFMNDDLGLDNFSPSLFETGVDFSSLQPNADALEGISDLLPTEAFEDAYGWAGGVTEGVNLEEATDWCSGAVGTVGDAAGGALDAAGDGAGDAIGFAGEIAGGAIDGVGGLAEAAEVAEASAGFMGSIGSAMGSAGEALAGAAGSAGDALGGMAEVAGAVAGAVGDAAGALGDLDL